jgi:hypothetical protein
MGRAFVAKLAAKGAHDPEALAAWIGRHKYGKKAFHALAAKVTQRRKAERHEAGVSHVYPGGRLASDLSTFDDDTLVRASGHGSPRDVERIAAELDRRYPPEPLPAASHTGDPVADLLADRAAIDAALGPLPSFDEWGQDDPDWGQWGSDEAAQQLIDAAEREHRNSHHTAGAPERITRAQAREMYDEHVYHQYLSAEDELRGVLLNRRGQAAGLNPVTLFSGPAHVAHANASDELREWWGKHGRMTQGEFIANATGVDTAAARRARKAESDQQNRR